MQDYFNSGKLRTLCVAGALCLAALVLFWPVFFQGKVLVPGDIPNTDPFLASDSIRPVRPQNLLLSDQIEQGYVGHRVASHALQAEGRLPRWNPYLFTGQPLVANAQSSLFYPPNLLLRFLTPGQVASIRAVFNLLCAGIFTYLFCRQLGISDRGSLLSAFSFSYSGPFLVWVGFPLANVLTCLPFLMWAGERLLKRPNAVRCALLGLGMGLSLLGGHPETSFQVLAVFSLYFLARLALTKELEGRVRALGCYLGAVVLGGMLSGIQILPFLDFLRHSSTLAHGGRASDLGGSVLYSKDWLAHLATAFTLWCPNFFGNPLDRSYIWPFETFQNYNEQAVYFGLVPMGLAAAAGIGCLRKRPVLILGCLALFCLAVAWHLPGFEAVSHLPIFSMAPSKRLRLPFVLLTSVLAGYGFDLVVSRARDGLRPGKGGWACLAVWLVALALLLWIVSLKVTIGSTVPPDSFRWLLLNNVFSATNWRSWLPLAVALTALSGWCLLARRPAGSRAFSWLLLALTVLELGALGWGYNPAVPESEILAPAPAIDFLKRDPEPFRILTTDNFFYPNFGAAYGIADVAGYDVPVYRRYSDLYLGQGGANLGLQVDSRQMWDPAWPLVDFLNVKYVVSPRELSPDRFRPVYQGRGFRIYRNLTALPRAFMVYQSRVLPEAKACLENMLGGRVELGREVLLDEAPPAPLLSAQPAARSRVSFRRYDNDEVQLEAETDRPGMLVLSDLYTEDWKVSVDGQPAKLYRANYSYRAVYLERGTHRVEFSYQPLSFRVGGYLTLAGLLVVALCIGVGSRRRSS